MSQSTLSVPQVRIGLNQVGHDGVFVTGLLYSVPDHTHTVVVLIPHTPQKSSLASAGAMARDFQQ